ncbi:MULTISPECIES: DUF3558 domain-containing protein [unclassified Crossiella]|uniref:DUF3558 domain-containing protein n=1 Tax=unclassified Crossiella TaxID=2620835 RepID=UPI001FFE6E3D|nr:MULTISPECIES: DUF3558 domain-containing protein [unclassified Crossiella]MCK2239744.1 DUF3558 domain-containing protein [Crossiella sp. S99.2]MCK2252439.1 DUF3558 domain-containing protein [Crossiella sp. S99.1]
MALVVLVSGCTPAPGTPTTSNATESSSTQAPTLPGRPKDIRLDDLASEQICSLLTEEQGKKLGVNTIRPIGDVGRFKDKGCGFLNSVTKPFYGYQIVPTTQEGADVWLKPGSTVSARILTVAGYPAVENRRPGDDRGCFVDVSVAEGQRLGIQYSYNSQPVTQTPEQLCAKALEMAELATQGLIKLHG